MHVIRLPLKNQWVSCISNIFDIAIELKFIVESTPLGSRDYTFEHIFCFALPAKV